VSTLITWSSNLPSCSQRLTTIPVKHRELPDSVPDDGSAFLRDGREVRMKLSLIVLTPGKMEGKTIPIRLPQFLIGRDPQCHLRSASSLISKRKRKKPKTTRKGRTAWDRSMA
jgi:hypothetical protein